MHKAEQYALPMAVEGTTEREVFTVDGAALADRLHQLERDGWRPIAMNRLPRNVGYTIECERRNRQ